MTERPWLGKTIPEMTKEEFDAMIDEEIKDSDEFHNAVIEFLKKIYPRAEWTGTEAYPYRGFIKISFTPMKEWSSENRQE